MKYILLLYFLYVGVIAQDKDKDVWQEVITLEKKQKYQQAQKVVNKILNSAQRVKENEQWCKALIRKVVLEKTINGYEVAISLLQEEVWPDDEESQAVLNLFYANILWNYYNFYSSEISERQKATLDGSTDFPTWNAQQIFFFINEKYYKAYEKRSILSAVSIKKFPDLIRRDGYPGNVRATMCDFLCYNWVEFLANTNTWIDQQSNGLHKIQLETLLASPEKRNFSNSLVDDNTHPIIKIITILDNLYFENIKIKNYESALESQLERIRILNTFFQQDRYKEKITKTMAELLPKYQDVRWWATGIYEYASLLQSQDRLIEAHDIALKAYEKYPGSLGGKKCLSFYKNLEAPTFTIESMGLDRLQQRSILVHHKNMEQIFFRVYELHFEDFLKKPNHYPGSVYMGDLQDIVKNNQHIAHWKTDFTDFYDYKTHKTYVVPQVKQKGFYMIAASVKEDFSFQKNIVSGTYILISDLVTIENHKPSKPHGWEIFVANGFTGSMIVGADVFLYEYTHDKGSSVVETQKTDENGLVFFEVKGKNHFVVVRHQDEISFDPNSLYHYENETLLSEMGCLIYTDRSIYKPGQKVLCKLVTYVNYMDSYKTWPNTNIDVFLLGPNDQVIEKKSVTTNKFGTASTKFNIPDGKMFGKYKIQTKGAIKLNTFSFYVAEYKYPSFGIMLHKPKKELLLNQKAEIEGSIKYYSGEPVISGNILYRITRIPQYPYWYWWLYDGIPSQGKDEVASGFLTTDKNGIFTISFTPEIDKAIPNQEVISYVFQVDIEATSKEEETQSFQKNYNIGSSTIKAKIILNNNFIKAKQDTSIAIYRTDLDDVPSPGKAEYQVWSLLQPAKTILPQDVTVTTISPNNSEGDLLRPRWEREHSWEEYLFTFTEKDCVAEGVLLHNEQGEARLFLDTLSAGAYRIRYNTTDNFGNMYSIQKEFIVAQEKEKLAVPLFLIPEKAHVQVGEKLLFLLGSGISNQSLSLEVYQGGSMLQKTWIKDASKSQFFEMDILEVHQGGFTVKLHGVHDYKHYSIEQNISVPWKTKKLEISFETFRNTLLPGQQETWTIKIKGNPSKMSEVLAYMYNKNLDFFVPHSYSSAEFLYSNKFGSEITRDNLFQRHFYNIHTKGFYDVPEYPYYNVDNFIIFSSYPVGWMDKRKNLQPKITSKYKDTKDKNSSDSSNTNGIIIEDEESTLISQNFKNYQNLEIISPTFTETVLWQPHLPTDNSGTVKIQFTAPESITKWKLYVHAITKDLEYATESVFVATEKQLAVKSDIPRFINKGDDGILKTVISNSSSQELKGKVTIEIIDLETKKDKSDAFFIFEKELSWFIEPKQSITIFWDIKAPMSPGNYLCKIVAINYNFSDGEQYSISVPSDPH